MEGPKFREWEDALDSLPKRIVASGAPTLPVAMAVQYFRLILYSISRYPAHALAVVVDAQYY